jgi:excisionase family DNA binding protein
MTPPQPPSFLTPRELAARWRVGLSTIYDYKDRGQLPYTLVCGRIRFRLDDVEAYEHAGYVAAPVAPGRLRGRVRPA